MLEKKIELICGKIKLFASCLQKKNTKEGCNFEKYKASLYICIYRMEKKNGKAK